MSRAKETTTTVVALLKKLIEDQDAVLSAASAAAADLSPNEDLFSTIKKTIISARESAVIKKDQIDIDGLTELLLSSYSSTQQLVSKDVRPRQKTLSASVREQLMQSELELVNHLIANTRNPEAYLRVRELVNRKLLEPKPIPIINQSLYVLTCANFESFLAGLLHTVLLSNDALLFSEGEHFSWKDISKRGAVQKLRRDLAKKRCDELLKQSANAWIKWFENRARMSIDPEFKTQCLATYKLRNVFIHESSSRAMRMSVVSIGDIENAVEVYLKLAVEMACSAVTTFRDTMQADRDKLFFQSTNLTHELLVKGRFHAAINIGKPVLGRSEKPLNETQVNVWLAERSIGKTGYLDEVRAWDTSEAGQLFELARYALLDDKNKARALARQLLNVGVLSQAHWLTWPLFDRVRGRALPMKT